MPMPNSSSYCLIDPSYCPPPPSFMSFVRINGFVYIGHVSISLLCLSALVSPMRSISSICFLCNYFTYHNNLQCHPWSMIIPELLCSYIWYKLKFNARELISAFLVCGCSRFNYWHLIWFLRHCREWSLSAELGAYPQNYKIK